MQVSSLSSLSRNSGLSGEQWKIQALDEIDLALAEKSLVDFSKQAWHVVEPATRYIHNWHIDAICEHLEAVTRGEIRNLLITMPPRCEKSLCVSVFWLTWVWTTRPETRWLFGAYAQSLSMRDSLKCRRIIESPWYQRRWGHRYQLTGDQNVKTRFENTKTGYRIASSVGGANTGEGAQFVICDDPHSIEEGESATIRTATLLWWDEVMSTRGNDPKTVGRVIVQQRVHEQDLAGHVLEQGGYVHLNLPMRFEPQTRCTVPATGWADPRTAEGELLWPKRFGETEVQELEKRLGMYGTSGQLQQRPSPRGGGKFKREWFTIVDAVPARLRSARAWDLAATEVKPGRDPDWTVGAKVGISQGVTYILDIQRTRTTSQGVARLVRQTAELDGRGVPIYVEQEPGSAGVNVIDYYRRQVLLGWEFFGERATGDKVVRAGPLASQAEAGNVKLLRGEWNAAFLDEMATFPFGKHDDQCDAVGLAFTKLTGAALYDIDALI